MNHGIKHFRSQELIDFAYRFATKAHGNQLRKYTGEPYIHHPIEVAKLVASVTNDCQMIAAAFLHDVLEDTDLTFDELRDVGFGFPIAALVLELTDISKAEDGNRKIRKRIDLEHLASASINAKTIKLADLIHNSKSILEYDSKFAKVYMREKADLLDVLKSGDATLYAKASKIVNDYYA